MISTAHHRHVLKILLGAVLGIVLLAGISVAVLSFWFDQAEGAPPPLSDGALQDFAVGHETWSRRLAETFPVGTPEATVLARLEDEGFETTPGGRTAHYEWGSGFPCIYTLTASWTTESGKITAISGDYLNACM